MLKITFLVCCLLGLALAAVNIAPLDPIPGKFGKQKGCYIKELDIVLPLGKSIPANGKCLEFRCGENYVYINGCPALAPGAKCKVVQDLSKPYPDCCNKIKC